MAIELLSPGDHQRLGKAVDLTRKMRTATLAVSKKELPVESISSQEQTVLHHARDMAQHTADFLIASFSDSSLTETRHALDDALRTQKERYDDISPYSYKNIPLHYSIVGLLNDTEQLQEDWQTILTHHYIERNQIPLQAFNLDQVGIIAPLSTDYMRAMLHRTFISQVAPVCFDVQPIATEIASGKSVLPVTTKGERTFADKKTIGIFIDNKGTGNTGRVVYEAVQEAYPEKIVFGDGRMPAEKPSNEQ